jgi:hypothetical protein
MLRGLCLDAAWVSLPQLVQRPGRHAAPAQHGRWRLAGNGGWNALRGGVVRFPALPAQSYLAHSQAGRGLPAAERRERQGIRRG